MFSPSTKKISYKLYLTIQALTVLVGTAFLVWHLVSAVHDLYISDKGEECVVSTLGNEILQSSKQNKESLDWTVILESNLDKLDHPAKKYAARELLERKCSDYLRVTSYEGSGVISLSVTTKNYIHSFPASISQRSGYIGLIIIVTSAILTVLYGLMKWVSWVFRE